MSLQPRVEFLDQDGNILASTNLPDDLLIEGEDRSIKQCDISARILKAGKVSQYRCVYANGEVITGAVIKKPLGNIALDIMLEQVDLQAGELIQGSYQVITVKET